MLQLLILRHANAAREPSNNDHDRALTERGREDARAMGRWLAVERLVPDLALVSDATRTRQTFDLVRQELRGRLRAICEPALYEADDDAILRVLNAIPDGPTRVLICGHNPGLHDVTLALIDEGGDPVAREMLRAGMPTSAIAVLAFDWRTWCNVAPRSGQLLRFVTPALISGQAGGGY